jgi:hypothetical protein
LKSSAMRMKAYEKQSFMKRRNENVEKSWICTVLMKKRDGHYSSVRPSSPA